MCDTGFQTYFKYEWIVKLIDNSKQNLSLICSKKQNQKKKKNEIEKQENAFIAKKQIFKVSKKPTYKI